MKAIEKLNVKSKAPREPHLQHEDSSRLQGSAAHLLTAYALNALKLPLSEAGGLYFQAWRAVCDEVTSPRPEGRLG